MAIHERVSAWEGEINDYKRRVHKSFVKAHKAIVLTVASKIIDYTPVATGRASASWVVSIGGPEDSADVGPGEYAGSKEMAKMDARAVIEQINEGNMYEKVYINNTVPYIDALEHGHSAQAPIGMVKLALMEVQSRFGRR